MHVSREALLRYSVSRVDLSLRSGYAWCLLAREVGRFARSFERGGWFSAMSCGNKVASGR